MRGKLLEEFCRACWHSLIASALISSLESSERKRLRLHGRVYSRFRPSCVVFKGVGLLKGPENGERFADCKVYLTTIVPYLRCHLTRRIVS